MDMSSNTGTMVPPSGTAVPPSGTMVPPSGTAVPPSGTAVPPSGTAVPPSGTAVPPSAKGNNVPADIPEYSEYIIKGKVYKYNSTISVQSGEAKIFKVNCNGNEYVLKIYKPQRHPNHNVLDIVQNSKGSGLLVDVYDHGVWVDKMTSVQYDYEIMQYCSSSSLASLNIKGDEAKLKQVALKMAMQIDFCHRHKILHRDIKPANFLYVRNNSKVDEFVLSDFGIGKQLDEQGRVATDGGRTPIYAAPEMYIYVPGRVNYVTVASDYYAMGMTLLALWIGEGKLIADEVKLVRDKQEETLPYPSAKEMTPYTLSLIKALTRRNPDKRAGFKDITRWAKGETLVIEGEKDTVRQDFRVVFSSTKNQIAHSQEELARFIWEDKDLGKRYLYQDQMKRWFTDMDRPEIALEIDEITEMLYPGNKDAGLYAVCCLLDPDTPFYGLKNKAMRSASDIAEEIFNNPDSYVSRLGDPNDLLWVYLRSNKQKQLADEFCPKIKNQKYIGLFCFCYRLNPKLPCKKINQSGNFVFKDVEAIFKALRDGILIEDNITLLLDEDVKAWLRYRVPTIDSIYNGMKNIPSKVAEAWRFVYELGSNLGYDFIPIASSGGSSLATIEDIAMKMAYEINRGAGNSGYRLSSQLFEKPFENTRLCQYLIARKKYAAHIAWIKSVMDLNSADNSKKYGPYNRQLAQVKAIAGLLPKGFPLLVDSKAIWDIKELEAARSLVVDKLGSKTLSQSLFENWLSVQFQENPRADYKKRSYYNLLNDNLRYQQRNFTWFPAASSATTTQIDISKAKGEFDDARKLVRIIQILVIVCCFIPLTVVSVIAVIRLAQMDSSAFNDIMRTIGKVAGWIVGIIGFIYGVAETSNLISGAIVGGLFGALIAFLCAKAAPIVPWILIAVIVLIMILFARNLFLKSMSKPKDTWSNMNLDTAAEYATIANAFSSRSKLLPNLPADYPTCVYKTSAESVRKHRGPFIRRALLMLAFTIAICFMFGWIKAKDIIGVELKELLAKENNFPGNYSGKFDGRNATFILDLEEIDGVAYYTGTVTIFYSSPLVHNVVARLDEPGDTNCVFVLKNQDGSLDEKITYDMQFVKGDYPEIIGSYSNRHKGSHYNFHFQKD